MKRGKQSSPMKGPEHGEEEKTAPHNNLPIDQKGLTIQRGKQEGD